ncbi:MAG: hypothetical protein V2J20_13140, partial [Wenzhouxiangella sp.]|nr:hypothetical protein [Wenzhouxiangella sp.]
AGALASASATAAVRMPTAPLAASYSNMAWFLVGFELGPWEEYLIHELTPDLERLSDTSPPEVSWLALEESVLLPDFAAALILRRGRVPNISLIRQYVVSDLSSAGRQELGRLNRSLVMPSLSAPFADSGALTVSAVLATQAFVAPGMNFSNSAELDSAISPDYLDWRQPDAARGAGLRFALSSELLDRMTVEASFQSRIGMSEFASVRGVHGSRAELDIPSRIQLGMQVQAGENSAFQLGLSQIFYSEVGAFPSRALPARFNALLGDSTSPLFGWEDLVVASIGWRWQPMRDLQLHLDYQTRAQPEPTSPLLANALAPELAKNAVTFGLNKTLSPRSRFLLNAAYAPPEFAFGGNVLGVVSDQLDQSMEVEAIWSLDF